MALAAYDIVRGYRATALETARELDTHSRVIAEQTARSLQAVDLVLRHIAGSATTAHARDLHIFLREQVIGLVQVEQLMLFDAQGKLVASSLSAALPEPLPDASGEPLFRTLQAGKVIEPAGRGRAPRPVPSGAVGVPDRAPPALAHGAFAGIVVAEGRVDYFQQFYRDVRLGAGTAVTLMHRNGTLVARYPAADTAMGQRFGIVEAMLRAARRRPRRPDAQRQPGRWRRPLRRARAWCPSSRWR